MKKNVKKWKNEKKCKKKWKKTKKNEKNWANDFSELKKKYFTKNTLFFRCKKIWNRVWKSK